MNKKRRKGFNQSTVRCPYCGSPAVLRSADGIYRDNSKNTMLYVCKNYPACDSYVRVHTGTNIPVGSLAITSCVLCEERHITILISSIRAG